MCLQSGEEANEEKKGLENEIERCIQRLDRAEKLTSGLEEENVRAGLGVHTKTFRASGT